MASGDGRRPRREGRIDSTQREAGPEVVTAVERVDGLEVLTATPAGGGRRPPVLFVHGTGCGAWIWQRWLSYFAARGYPSRALSLRGHGGSDGSYRSASMADYLEDMRLVLKQYDSPPVLIGQSMGARLIQQMVEDATHPAAVLLTPPPLAGLPRRIGAVQMLRHPAAAVRSVLGRDMEPMFRAPGVARLFFSPAIDQPTLDEFDRLICGESFELYMKELPSAAPVRAPLPIPSLLAAARYDQLPVDALRRDAQRLGAEFVVLENVGHNLMIDAAWKEAADVAATWLDGVVGVN